MKLIMTLSVTQYLQNGTTWNGLFWTAAQRNHPWKLFINVKITGKLPVKSITYITSQNTQKDRLDKF